MASTAKIDESSARPPAARIGVVRLALTGAIVSGLFFLLCWVGMFLPIGAATHTYLALFTAEEVTSVGALLQGTLWSVIFGAVVGGLTATVFNALSTLD